MLFEVLLVHYAPWAVLAAWGFLLSRGTTTLRYIAAALARRNGHGIGRAYLVDGDSIGIGQMRIRLNPPQYPEPEGV
jgi:hypothetical protein